MQHILVNVYNEILNESRSKTIVISSGRLNDAGELWMETGTVLRKLFEGLADFMVGHYQRSTLTCRCCPRICRLPTPGFVNDRLFGVCRRGGRLWADNADNAGIPSNRNQSRLLPPQRVPSPKAEVTNGFYPCARRG
jgi:hypothetical protein